MNTIAAAPFLRGLALDVRPEIPAFVASAIPSSSVPAGSVPVNLTGSEDENGLQDALRKAVGEADPRGRVFSVRMEGQSLFLAVAADLEGARALLGGAPSAAAALSLQGQKALPTQMAAAPKPGSSSGRDRVVAGKAALVTGGAQGFGEEIVRGLASSGATVYVADLNLAGAEKLAAKLNAAYGRIAAIPVAIDVSKEESVTAAFDTVERTTGGLDLVVSNAGVLKAASVLEQDAASFEFVTRVNYTGFFLVAKHAGLLLRAQRAGAPRHRTDIVQINSKSGLAGSNKNGAYAGSKFGGLGLVQSFALELVEYGIKVNAICPGNFFDGPLWSDPDRGLFVQYLRTGKVPGARTVADVKAFYEAKVPMGRGCEGPDVMRALYYLVEQEYETGQALPVTGGQVMLN
jgi:sorbitol-6-phosphate 2-dehydrogenase